MIHHLRLTNIESHKNFNCPPKLIQISQSNSAFAPSVHTEFIADVDVKLHIIMYTNTQMFRSLSASINNQWLLNNKV